MVARDGGIQDHHAQAAQVVAAVNREHPRFLVQERLPEVGALIMVAHGPDELGTHPLRVRFAGGPQPAVGRYGSLVRQVSREDDGFRIQAACLDGAKDFHESRLGIQLAVQQPLFHKVRVTDVDQHMVGGGVLRPDHVHGSLSAVPHPWHCG
jgi:hypothetical protein